MKYLKQMQSPAPVYKPAVPAMTEAISLPLGVPAFKPIPKVVLNAQQPISPQSTFQRKAIMYQPNSMAPNSSPSQQLYRLNNNMTYISNQITRRQAEPAAVPSFQAMPSKAMSRISTGQILQIDNNIQVSRLLWEFNDT